MGSLDFASVEHAHACLLLKQGKTRRLKTAHVAAWFPVTAAAGPQAQAQLTLEPHLLCFAAPHWDEVPAVCNPVWRLRRAGAAITDAYTVST